MKNIEDLKKDLGKTILAGAVSISKDDLEKLMNMIKEVLEKEEEKPKEEKVKTIWDLKAGDLYYLITSSGMILDKEFQSDYSSESRRNTGNVFLTGKDATIEIQKRRVEALLQKYGGVPFRKLNHKKDTNNYVIIVTYEKNEDEYEVWTDYIGFKDVEIAALDGIIPFAFTSEIAMYDAIDEIGKDRLIAYACGELFEID
jgi:hypothetical protein